MFHPPFHAKQFNVRSILLAVFVLPASAAIAQPAGVTVTDLGNFAGSPEHHAERLNHRHRASRFAPGCDSIDFNNDGLFPDDADLVAFLTVLAGGAC